MDPFHLVISSPLPEGKRLSWIDLNPYRTALKWRTGLGGFVSLDAGYHQPGMPPTAGGFHTPIEVPDLATAQLYFPSESGFTCFEGRVMEADDEAGLRTTALKAFGFGTSDGALGDDPFSVPPAHGGQKDINDVERTAVNLLRKMTTSTTDILQPGGGAQVTDPGGSYAPRRLSGQYLGQAVDQIVKAGAAGGLDVEFAVWEDRRWILRPMEPSIDEHGYFLPDYRIAQDARLTRHRDMHKMVGAVAVEYTVPGAAKQTTPWTSTDGWSDAHGGLYRAMLIPTSAISQAQALLVRDRWKMRNAEPVATYTVTLKQHDRRVEGRFGQPIPYYVYRYGQWVSIGSKAFFITSTEINASAATATVKFVNVPWARVEEG